MYTDDGLLDETMAVKDHDVVLVPRGHHPCSPPYGFEMYYLNVMAGPLRKWRFVPSRDRYQIVSQYQHPFMQALDTGLDVPLTEKFVLVEVVSRPRGRDAKIAFYKNLCAILSEKCGISDSDVMISFVENFDVDWSFGYGRAQFLTGEL